MTKAALRQKLLAARRELTPEDRNRFGQEIQKSVFASKAWATARCIGCYVSLADEAPTQLLLTQALAEKKIVTAPVVLSAGDNLVFRRFAHPSELTLGPMKIFQPLRGEAVSPEKIDLLIVPGVAFDLRGYRLGYGRGYYDRFLSIYSGWSLGLAFEIQMVNRLPFSAHDQPVRQVLTELRNYLF